MAGAYLDCNRRNMPSRGARKGDSAADDRCHHGKVLGGSGRVIMVRVEPAAEFGADLTGGADHLGAAG
jgi:hypothetical protein